MQTLSAVLGWRYATKAFDTSKKLEADQLDLILNAARMAPSSYGLQPWKFIVVKDAQTRATLRAASWDQSQITDASDLIVFAVPTVLDDALVDTFIASVAAQRGLTVDALAGYAGMIKGALNGMDMAGRVAWAKKQAYVALGFALAQAAEAGIDSCPMEGFDASKYDEVLGLSALGLTAAVVLPVGFRSEADQSASYPKVRFSKEEVVIQK